MSRLPGQWYDGRSSRPRAVQLTRVTPDLLRIETDDGEIFDWPLPQIRINPRLGNTPRILRRDGHGQIETSDSPLLAQWFSQLPSRVEGFADWLERRRVAILGAAVVTALGAVAFVVWGVPWLATGIAERMPASVEARVSQQVIALLQRTHLNPSKLPASRQAVLIGKFQRLIAGQSRAGEMRLRFAAAPAIGANAFALPDGQIFVTDELVALADNDEELLAVLAHEAGHHVHRHGMRQAVESSSVLLVASLMFGDVSGASLAVSIPAVLLTNGFSRGHELEADNYAFALLRQRRISPKAFADVMRRLSKDVPEDFEHGPIGYLSTHPPTPGRIQAAERAAAVP